MHSCLFCSNEFDDEFHSSSKICKPSIFEAIKTCNSPKNIFKSELILFSTQVLHENYNKTYFSDLLLLITAYFDSFIECQSLSFKYDVFLGGACNPTTWRLNEAIPILQESGLSYYNPQTENWSDSLIEKEKNAKVLSRFHLFVFEQWTTRCLTSMIEVAYLIARNASSVILVWCKNTIDNHLPYIRGEKLSQTEYRQLNQAKDFVLEIAEFCAVPVFDDVPSALRHLRQAVAQCTLRENRRNGYPLHNISSEERKIWHKICRIRDIFDGLDRSQTGSITLEKARAGLHRLHADLAHGQMNATMNFKQFCSNYVTYTWQHNRLLDEYEVVHVRRATDKIGLQHRKSFPDISLQKKLQFRRSYSFHSSDAQCPIHLTGVVVRANPLDNLYPFLDALKRRNIACHHPSIRTEDYLPDILSKFNLGMHSSTIFYMIQTDHSHLNLMIEASFMLGCGFPVVLCVKSPTSDNVNVHNQHSSAYFNNLDDPLSPVDYLNQTIPPWNRSYYSFSSNSELDCRKEDWINHGSRESSIFSSVDIQSPMSVDSGCAMSYSPDTNGLADYYRAKRYLVSIAEEAAALNNHTEGSVRIDR